MSETLTFTFMQAFTFVLAAGLALLVLWEIFETIVLPRKIDRTFRVTRYYYLATWPGKIVTEVTQAGPFWEAEPEHQDYLERYPNGYTCHFVRPNWQLPRRAEVHQVTRS